MASYCVRCREQVHGKAEDQPHLCHDLVKRLERRRSQTRAVEDILDHAAYERKLGGAQGRRVAAEMIVAVLSQMGVADDV